MEDAPIDLSKIRECDSWYLTIRGALVDESFFFMLFAAFTVVIFVDIWTFSSCCSFWIFGCYVMLSVLCLFFELAMHFFLVSNFGARFILHVCVARVQGRKQKHLPCTCNTRLSRFSLEAARLGGDSFVCLIAEGAAGVLPLSLPG